MTIKKWKWLKMILQTFNRVRKRIRSLDSLASYSPCGEWNQFLCNKNGMGTFTERVAFCGWERKTDHAHCVRFSYKASCWTAKMSNTFYKNIAKNLKIMWKVLGKCYFMSFVNTIGNGFIVVQSNIRHIFLIKIDLHTLSVLIIAFSFLVLSSKFLKFDN